MEWLPFATIAYLVWSIATLTSKVLLSRYTSSLVVYTVSLGLVSLLPLLLVPVRGLTIPNPGLLCMALVGGMLYIMVIMLYFKALSLEEASRVIPLWRFTPIFVLLLSGYLIDEHLTHYQLIAFVLLVLGGFGVSVKRIGDTFKLSPAFYWMLFSSLVGAIYNVLIKFIYLRLLLRWFYSYSVWGYPHGLSRSLHSQKSFGIVQFSCVGQQFHQSSDFIQCCS
ncbi:EamA family transporter [Leptolyngbya sp. FACHB-16]|uniref:EamA family transporter n=1 Tax=unclassified Leptolyngbya TaxID=2650499 RepID=UPI0016877E38|nr:EamA family transporter [Leptolyngbya sp. FACHB-16]MBD2156912.1 EamA family transporter [Leptolyngbya sp. FACHB-16]